MKSDFVEVSCEEFVKFVATGEFCAGEIRESFIDGNGDIVAKVSRDQCVNLYLARKDKFNNEVVK